MCGAISRLLIVVLLVGCHPKYDLRGTGGSGGFDTIKARILALIASHEYGQAREYLELAADLTQEQHDHFEQMISAAERGLVPFLEGALPHIFKATAGHFLQDTAEARELLQTTAVEEHLVGIQEKGFLVYQRILDTGTQVWVYVFNGTIRDGGINAVPRSTERLLTGR